VDVPWCVFGASLLCVWCVVGAPISGKPLHTLLQLSNSMDDKLKAILDSLPPKRQRSKLEPYIDLIDVLRRRSRTFREIAHILADKCELIVDSSTVVRFVAARSRSKRRSSKFSETERLSKKTKRTPEIEKTAYSTPSAPADEVWKRIEALKQRPAQTVTPRKQFEYDPDQPLHLRPHAEKKTPKNNT